MVKETGEGITMKNYLMIENLSIMPNIMKNSSIVKTTTLTLDQFKTITLKREILLF